MQLRCSLETRRNIAAADGHPAEIMDMSFAVQALSALYVLRHHGELGNHVINVSDEIDDLVARRKLAAWGTQIDTLTDEQKKDLVEGYLIPEAAKNNYIELGNVLSDMLQEQIDTTRKELLHNEF